MFDHMFTPWGTLTTDGQAFAQNAIVLLAAAAIVAAILFTRRR